MIEDARLEAPQVPLLFAVCAPCQPFTTLSRSPMSTERLAKRERDRNLLRSAALLVDRYRPELVLSENVAGIRDPRYGGIWDGFADDLTAMGYTIGTRLVCVSGFGVAQYRKRSILLAVRSDVLAPPPRWRAWMVGWRSPRDVDAPAMSVAEVIGHLPRLIAGETHPEIPNHRAARSVR